MSIPEPPSTTTYYYTYPDVEAMNAEMPLEDVEKYLERLENCGRKKNEKTEIFQTIFRSYSIDSYYVFCRLFTDSFAHPEMALGVGTETLLDIAGDTLFASRDQAEKLRDSHDDSLAMAAREYGDYSSGLPEYSTLGQLYVSLKDVALSSDPKSIIRTVMRECPYPSVWLQMLGDGPTMYVYTDNILFATHEKDHPKIVTQAELLGDAPLSVYNWYHDDRYELLSTEPHIPIGEMKAKSEYDASNIDELNHEKWVAQTKYDGARIYVHYNEDNGIRAYLAGGRDVTPVLPELFEDPLWSELPGHAFILDGEAVPYDPDTGEVLNFQHVLKRTGREDSTRGIEDDVEIKFKFFDVLYWRNKDVTGKPYEHRLGLLKDTFLPPRVAQTGEKLEATFQRSLEEGHEGVVLKAKDHMYDFDTRSDMWQKWKAEPMEADFYAVTLNEGTGDMKGMLGSIELALELGTDEMIIVGSVGTGFTERERKRLWDEDAWTDRVVQVSFEELQYSKDEGWSLRFPSFDAQRPEGEVDTLERVACEIADKEEEYEVWKGGY